MSDTPLRGKTALVTGGAKRLGRIMALTFAQNGADVIVHYNSSRSEAQEVVAAARSCGVQAWALQADLSTPREVDTLFGDAISLAGCVNILINNASVFGGDTLMDFEPEAIGRNMGIHAVAPALLGRKLARQRREAAIINMVDARAVDYDREHFSYHVSKRALLSLTKMMALEFAPAVRVNAIAPGLILAPEGEGEEYLEQLASTNPLNTYGNPEQIAQAALFLLTNDFVTGQVIFVDGGRHLKGEVYG